MPRRLSLQNLKQAAVLLLVMLALLSLTPTATAQEVPNGYQMVCRYTPTSAEPILKMCKSITITCTSHSPFGAPQVGDCRGEQVAILENLHKSFGSRVIYEGFNLTIRRGERWAVMGRNGAGKTTLLKMIAGASAPDAEFLQEP